jgi:RNA polymerase sigma-70 factor (ECF subfamily)
VRAAQAGDRVAFSTLVERHLRVTHAVALAVLGRAEDAEDAVQDAFLIAYDRLADCRDPARFRSWLLRIVRNRAYNLMEYRRVRRHDLLDDSQPDLQPANDPLAGVERSQLRERLSAALARLKPVHREVVLLHDLEGLAHAEIAHALGISEPMCRKHLMNGRKLLRSLLQRENDHA